MSSATNFLSANLDHVRQHVDQVKYHVVPTLADIGQLVWDDLTGDDEEYNEDEISEEEEEEELEDLEEQTEEGTPTAKLKSKVRNILFNLIVYQRTLILLTFQI